MVNDKNFDNVFVRRVLVGLASFLYDIIEIEQNVNGETTTKRVPFFYSMSGGNNSDQYITDLYMNTDRYCNELDPTVEGNISQVPSGVISLGSNDVSQEDVGAGYTRVNFKKEFETEFTQEMRDMSARGDFLPIKFSMEIKIKCGSEIERMKIWEQVITKLWKLKKYWIKYKGFPKLPCTISFPDAYNMDKNFQWRFAENKKRPQLVYGIELLAWLPVLHENTERFDGNRIEDGKFTPTFSEKKDEDCPDDDETANPNDDYKLEKDK